MSLPDLTVINRYSLLAPAEAFETAIAELSARKGDPGMLSYQFFVNPGAQIAQAVSDDETPAA